MLQAVVDLRVLPENSALVPRLLYPLHGDIARSRHRAGIGAGPGAGGDQDRVIAPPCGMNGSAIIQSADIDVNGGRRRLISHHGAAQRRIESHAFVRHRNQLGCWPSPFLSFGHTLLPKGNLGTRNEKQMFDAAKLHRLDQRVRPLIGAIFLPTEVMGNCFSHDPYSFCAFE